MIYTQDKISDIFKIAIAQGLTKKSSTKCSTWSTNYVVLGKPKPGKLSFEWHPWAKEMHDCDVDWVGEKSAQMAFTQTALDRSIYTVDILKRDVLYLLPKKNPDASDFSKSKFDTMLELSPYIANLFSNVKNMGHKQSGSVNLYIRGMRSTSGLRTISTALKVYDEYDEMIQKNVALADERSSGFETDEKQNIKISTPTIPEFGIDAAMMEANEEHYIFKCPRCGRRTEWDSIDQVEVVGDSLENEKEYKKSYLKCRECKREIKHEEKREILHYNRAKWEIVKNRQSSTRGFQIPQLYSTVMRPWEIARQILRARKDPNYEQELYNSKMGKPWVPKGARVEDFEFLNCRMNHMMGDPPPTGGLITMGVDVGHQDLYYKVSEWLVPPTLGRQINLFAIKRTLKVGIVHDFNELDLLMYNYQVLHAVVDIDPAFREATAFCDRFKGHVNLCRFVRGIEKNSIVPKSDQEYTVFVNRTAWLDISQGRYKKGPKSPGGIMLPRDIPTQYKDHIQVLVRLIRANKEGNLTSQYISTKPDDHFAFANVYDDIALPLALSGRYNQDVKNYI